MVFLSLIPSFLSLLKTAQRLEVFGDVITHDDHPFLLSRTPRFYQ